MIPIIFFLITIICAVSAFIIYKVDNNKHEQFVKSHSVALKNLAILNSKYSFYEAVDCDMLHTYDNESFFHQIDCRDFLIYQLQFEQGKILQQISKIHKNKVNHNKYVEELEGIGQWGKYDTPYEKLKLQKLIKIEKSIYSRSLLRPPVSFFISVTLFCSRLNGTIYAKKAERFDEQEISSFIKRLNNKNGSFFNDKDIWSSLCKVERGKVSNKLRFAIYQKDGYRCRHCGVSERYATLEIDHIIPIARGGKSTYDNLQTLCHSCNVKKGDSFPYNPHRRY